MSLTQPESRRDDNRSKVIFVLDGLSGAVQEVIFFAQTWRGSRRSPSLVRVISFPFDQKWYLLWTAPIIQIQFAQCRLVILSYSCSDNGAIQGRVSLQHGLSLHTAYNQSRIAGSRGFKNKEVSGRLHLWSGLYFSLQYREYTGAMAHCEDYFGALIFRGQP